MKRILIFPCLLFSICLFAQDSSVKKPVQIFSSQRAIQANTTEPVGKGKMIFLVTHYFDDLGGHAVLRNFFGLDNSTDVKIGFNIGLTKRLDASIAHCKGGPGLAPIRIEKNIELAFKYQLMQQLENDPSHPIAMSLFYSNSISTLDTTINFFQKFQNFGERMSHTFQLIVAKRMKNVSVQLNPTITIQGYQPSYELQRTMFALGGVIRFPAGKRFNIIVDYIHPFRSEESKAKFKSVHNIKFFDPLGIGLEVLTAGHVFTLNFTNATQIQEARFIPYTVKSWGTGGFRWGFTVSRKFTLWRDKK